MSQWSFVEFFLEEEIFLEEKIWSKAGARKVSKIKIRTREVDEKIQE